MSDFVLYALIESEWKEEARFADSEGFFASIQRHFDALAAEGKPLLPADIVLGLWMRPTVVARGKYGLVKRALRNHDEIGIAAELTEAISAAKAQGADAIGWGTDAATLATLPPYDFGDLAI